MRSRGTLTQVLGPARHNPVARVTRPPIACYGNPSVGLDSRRLRLLDGDPPELLVYDELGPCPYLPGQRARLPMRLPVRPLTAGEFDDRLQGGDRRQGLLLYRPRCPSCNACEAIRLNVHEFRGNKTQRRIFRKGEDTFTVERARPELSREKVDLYNRHKTGRDLMGEGDPIDTAGYGAFLVDTCVDTFELRYRVDGKLVGVAVVDESTDALSAVYTYFDPDYGKLSPGVYSIMKQVAMCREMGRSYLYLGLYVADCKSMAYKSRYLPHERQTPGPDGDLAWVKTEV